MCYTTKKKENPKKKILSRKAGKKPEKVIIMKKATAIYLAFYLLVGGAWFALSATCMLGYMGVAKPMAENMTKGVATCVTAIASCQADPSEENCLAQQAKVNELATSFTGSMELPAWVTNLQEYTNTPDMTADDNYLSFMLNAVPEGVQKLFTEGKIIDVAEGNLDELDFVLDYINKDDVTEEDFDAAISELEELKEEFKASMENAGF